MGRIVEADTWCSGARFIWRGRQAEVVEIRGSPGIELTHRSTLPFVDYNDTHLIVPVLW